MPEAVRRGGRIRVILGTNPAAGAEVLETVPAGVQWRLIAMSIELATAAAVANRYVRIGIDDGVNAYYFGGTGIAQVASTIYTYVLGPHGALSGIVSDWQYLPVQAGMILLAGHRIRTTTVNLQAADDYAAPSYMVEEWPA